MVAHHTLGTHRCEPDTPLADNRSNDLRLVAMRGAAPPATLSPRHTRYPRETKELQMRLITMGLTTILATLALASPTFAAASTNRNSST